jgi:hypothetical protein
MRPPSLGLARSAVEIMLFILRTTVERPNTYGCEDPANPDRHNIRARARLLDTLASYCEPMSDSGHEGPRRGKTSPRARALDLHSGGKRLSRCG